ncbi:hypothetical protein G6O69_09400 [Pseudenhygromyxa sp. WMMC2535]|uniref:hypothetical protein n=1 Tax=Pseudenhygromyxa sp. WMMC2535 TaxID=2712867 RepID=UPI0015562139|nr:hypothetical protein [Pseudenhygromyxa sp. WMMC2535]NVB38047.1 hypothetical protein [Pseudenhygromyxa sp. WMMC2535]
MNTPSNSSNHDDSILADADPDFTALDRAVAEPEPWAGPDLLLLVDELVEELVQIDGESTEEARPREALEISITLELEDAQAEDAAGDAEVAEVA